MDIRVLVPREPGEINITTAIGTLQFWHERLGQRDKLVAKGGWMMSACSMDIRVLVPTEPAEINITTALEIILVWHERLGHQDKRHVQKY
jgi:hypothetical protein